MKPLIAITVDVGGDPGDERSHGKLMLNYNYAEQVALAGGNPILITPLSDFESIAPLIDGWLIPGGKDIDAERFGEANHPQVSLQDERRWHMESALYDRADPAMPILGICYGAQFLNVKRSGSLHQHLPDLLGHDQHSGGTLQTYELDPGSLLAQFAGVSKVSGKSYHHQAINRLGKDLVVSARAEDHTVEAIEDPRHPFLIGVQWHPERTPGDSATKSLMRAFVGAARAYQQTKS